MLSAMCSHDGLIQLALTFNQPRALSTQVERHSIEARRETLLIQREAET
jgi:hypothetical protein